MSETMMSKAAAPAPAARTPSVTVGGSGDPRLAGPVLGFLDAINRGDLDRALGWLTPDALHQGRVSNYTPEGVRVLFGMVREAFPDVRFDVRDIRVEGRRVITRIAATGTHTGTVFGREPTGRPVAWQSVDIAEIVDSAQVVEVERAGDADVTHAFRVFRRQWDLWNDPEMWKEIGFIPAIMC
jgi:predicted ester cyclase